MRPPRRSSRVAGLFCALVLTAAGAAGAEDEASSRTAWPTAGWETSAPEAQGVSSAALADLIDFGATRDFDSLLVVRHGRIVVEATYAPFQPGLRHVVNSVTKAVVGTLVGVAVGSGAIASVDEPVVASFGGRSIANVDADKRAITIAHLLDMTSGIDWREPLTNAAPETMLQMERSGDWVGFILDRPMARPPGQAFNYDSGDWHLLSALLAKKTGMPTVEYAKRTLFEPLGIADLRWREDPQGIAIGGYGLFLQPRDMAKVGYLELHHGAWAGRQIVPAAWTERAFRASLDMGLGSAPAFHYASGWWTIPDRKAVLAVGFLGQLIVVLPEIDVVAVVTARRNGSIVPLVDRIVAAASSPTPLPTDDAGRARLAARVAAVAVEPATPVMPAPPLAQAISGRRCQLDRNPLGLQSLSLELGGAEPRLHADLASAGSHRVRHIDAPIGLDGLFRRHESDGGVVLALKGGWRDESTFEIVSRSLTEGIVLTYALAFSGSSVEVSFESNQGFRGVIRGRCID